MVLHIPHASTHIPSRFSDFFVLSKDDLERELILLTDAHTDELFEHPDFPAIRFPYSRLLVDVERFRDDTKEPMFQVGMGKIYMRTAEGKPLKRELSAGETDSLVALYDAHHSEFTRLVQEELADGGSSIIVDCHSFPSFYLTWLNKRETLLPDFCIGSDPFHTPENLVQEIQKVISALGYSVEVNWPFSGSIVPSPHHEKTKNVRSIMIEVNRKLYMNELTGDKTSGFERTKNDVQTILREISEFAENEAKG